jgi:uncharacterized protein YndB with AHSA1/START domain
MMHATIDRDTFTISFERKLPAPRAEVFDAWTKPEQIAEWWDPTGARLVTCEIDLRPGGAFRFVNDGHGPPFAGTYAVIERPARLVFEAMGSVGTVTLETEGNGTRMSVTIRCASKEHLEHFVKMGVADGTERTLDNLVRYVGGSSTASAVS